MPSRLGDRKTEHVGQHRKPDEDEEDQWWSGFLAGVHVTLIIVLTGLVLYRSWPG